MQLVGCVIVNEASSSPLVSQVTPSWLVRCAAACECQLLEHVGPIWADVIGQVRVASGPSDIKAGELVFAIVDSLPDAPGAVAYHDVQGNAAPVAFLALSACTTLDDVSTAISHELCETTGDEACNRWADDGQGSEFAIELCDAVESNAYPCVLGDGGEPILVSDFLLPEFFFPGSVGPYSYMGTQAANRPEGPLQTAEGGYQIKRSSGGGETQVTGKVRELRAAKVAHFSSRATRRGASYGAQTKTKS